MVKCDMLETPAPFVFGGSFSDFKNEGLKFGRFSTLSSLAKAANVAGASDEPTRDEQIQQMYSEAREQEIGTVNRIDIPEGSIKIVNLVEVARYIQATLMPESIADGEEEDEEEIEEEEEEEVEDEEDMDEIDDADEEVPRQVASEDIPARACVGSLSKSELAIATPIVYSGSFQDFKKERAKFIRFSTLASFSKAVDKAARSQADTSASLRLKLTTDPMSLATSEDYKSEILRPQSFIESTLAAGSLSCQLLALAMPPSMNQDSSVYVTLSDRIVKKALCPTLAESRATVKKIVAKPAPELVPAAAIASDILPTTAHINKSPYRFRFMADELGAINTMGLSSAKVMQVNNGKIRDDGSNWIVDHTSIGGSAHRHSFRSSGSSWGGGGAQLAPICQDKLRLDSLATVTVPPRAPRT